MLIAAALDGAGAHPAAARVTGTTAAELFDPQRLVSLVRTAERGGLDLVTVDDQQPVSPGPDQIHGNLDAVVVLALAAARTRSVGLVATGVATGDPAALAVRFATLGRVGGGRVGWRPRVALTDEQRRAAAADPDRFAAFTTARFAELDGYLDTVTDLWRRWSTGPTGGIGIRPGPAGHPLVILLAHFAAPYRLAARYADIVLVTPTGTDDLLRIRRELTGHCRAVGRNPRSLAVLADVTVVLGATAAEAEGRHAALEAALGEPYSSDALVVPGTAAALADLIEDLHLEGGADGVRLRPAALPEDLVAVTTDLIPLLRRRGLIDDRPVPLRDRLRHMVSDPGRLSGRGEGGPST